MRCFRFSRGAMCAAFKKFVLAAVLLAIGASAAFSETDTSNLGVVLQNQERITEQISWLLTLLPWGVIVAGVIFAGWVGSSVKDVKKEATEEQAKEFEKIRAELKTTFENMESRLADNVLTEIKEKNADGTSQLDRIAALRLEFDTAVASLKEREANYQSVLKAADDISSQLKSGGADY